MGLEVGTGCTVWVKNRKGFSDHAIWNPGDGEDGETADFCRDFVSVIPARAARPVKLVPKESWVGAQTLSVEDRVYAKKMFGWGRPRQLKTPPWMADADSKVTMEEDEGFFKREYLEWYQ